MPSDLLFRELRTGYLIRLERPPFCLALVYFFQHGFGIFDLRDQTY
ncbi:MAG: hypothetical protein WAL75_04330 [Terracidiphilus sp.]